MDILFDGNLLCPVQIIYDRETGLSCGYGYVTMSTVQEAEKALELYNRRVSITDKPTVFRSLLFVYTVFVCFELELPVY
jgi:RNA recognition motif-containing protein